MRTRLTRRLARHAFKAYGKHAPRVLHTYFFALYHFHARSGAFTVDELLDKMGKDHRSRKRAVVMEALADDILFGRRGSRYYARAQRKMYGHHLTFVIEFHDFPSMKKAEFTAHCIALMAAGTRSYEYISKMTGFSVPRVRKALDLLVKAGRVQKQHNFGLKPYDNELEAQRERSRLRGKGIVTPRAIDTGSGSAVALFLPNSYRITRPRAFACQQGDNRRIGAAFWGLRPVKEKTSREWRRPTRTPCEYFYFQRWTADDYEDRFGADIEPAAESPPWPALVFEDRAVPAYVYNVFDLPSVAGRVAV
jgi:hypothetical protein